MKNSKPKEQANLVKLANSLVRPVHVCLSNKLIVILGNGLF